MKTVFLSFSIVDSSVTDFFFELSTELSKENKVIIITDRLEKEFEVESNIEIFKWPSKRPTKFKDFVFLSKLIIKFRPSLMISIFGAVNIFAIAGFVFNVENRVAWCRTLSSQFKNKKILEYRKRLIYKLCTRILVNSNAVKEDLINNFGVDNAKLQVVYNAVKLQDINSQVDINKIVFVGRMHPSKGIDTLLKAMPVALKQFPKLKLKIIGGDLESDESKRYREITTSLQINDNVIFMGYQTKEIVLKEFSSAYFTVVPSVNEAFGFVVIESFSVRTPVIGSNSTGIAEIIRDTQDGFLFVPKDENDLSAKMILLLKNPLLRNEFSRNCHKRFLENFELKKAIQETTVVFQNLL